jgi:hypothetical protein
VAATYSTISVCKRILTTAKGSGNRMELYFQPPFFYKYKPKATIETVFSTPFFYKYKPKATIGIEFFLTPFF